MYSLELRCQLEITAGHRQAWAPGGAVAYLLKQEEPPSPLPETELPAQFQAQNAIGHLLTVSSWAQPTGMRGCLPSGKCSRISGLMYS